MTDETKESASPAEGTPALPPSILQGERGLGTALIFISAFLIVAAACVAYMNSWRIPLQGEDQQLFLADTALHRMVTCTDAIDTMPHAPLTLFGYALNWWLTPGAAGLHAVNLLLHLANAVLLYFVCRRLLRPGVPEAIAMLAGILFAVLPATSNSVNYLIGRPSLQATFFALLAVLLFLRATESSRNRYGLLAAGLCCYVMAFASNAGALVLPIVLLALDHVLNGGEGLRRHANVHLGAFGTLVVLAAVRHASGIPESGVYPAGLGATLTAQSAVARTAFSLYPLPLLSVTPAFSLVGAGILLVLAVLAAVGLLKRSPAGVALLWGLAALTTGPCLIPAGNIFVTGYTYFASAGLMLLAPWLLLRLTAPAVRTAGGLVAAFLVLAACAVTVWYTDLWTQPDALWTRAAAAAPESPEPWRYLARYRLQRADEVSESEQQGPLLQAAAEAWGQANERAPGDSEILSKLGAVWYRLEKPDAALPLLEEALRLDPFDQDAALYIARIYEQQMQTAGGPDRLRQAIDYFRRAESLGSLPPEILARYGMALSALGNFQDGIPLLRRAAEGQEESPVTVALQQLEALNEQAKQLEQAAQRQLTENPKSIEGFVSLAESAVVSGQVQRAFYLLDSILRKTPGDQRAWTLMGFVRARMGGASKFLDEWGTRWQGREAAWKDLATRCAHAQAWDAALTYLAYGGTAEQALPPAVRLADIALELRQPRRAQALLEQAAQAHPEDPSPWLKLADLAIAAQDTVRAGQYLAQAEQRNAFPEATAARRQQAGIDTTQPLQPVRTIIR